MSKLDREIKAILDDMSSQAHKLLPKLIEVMMDVELDDDEMQRRLVAMLEEAKPKTYDIYIADLKQVFREAGWKELGAENNGTN